MGSGLLREPFRFFQAQRESSMRKPTVIQDYNAIVHVLSR